MLPWIKPTRIGSPAWVHSAAAARRLPHTATAMTTATTTTSGTQERKGREERKEKETTDVTIAALTEATSADTP
jgi:hypothetical protein